ncbi:glycosyltransferase [Bacteriovorax sp. DB6_IX]|uniref:glycosyltransferase n=1 Tax=Bacteriovorax sp. DB6_IX TaxID=1353530 RepID=UPI00038A37ED|nr:glycosyltransferase [Bacteriovorax sp. DB6_IX]EQC43177.1 glycosyltransferase, group 1 family protein [Bacteriovorax sp. DB6_IX]
MRIGFFNGYSIWGGGEKWHIEMAKNCHDKGDKVFIYSPIDGELAKRSRDLGFHIRDVQITKNSYFNIFFYFKVKAMIERDKLDVLVFNSFRDVRSAALAVKAAKVKKVVLRCGMPIAPKQSLSYRLAFQRGIDYFVPISEAVRDEFKNKSPLLLSENKYAPVIANGIDLDDFSYVGETSEELITLGNAVRLSHQKGLDMLLPSLKILKERGHHFVMKIAGTGEESESLEKLRSELGLEKEVEFLGHTDDVASFVKTIDIYAFTSRYEGTARSMIEAMACGKPVVAFNTSSMKEVVADSKSGFLAEAFSEEDFANKLEILIKDKNLRAQFGKNGRQIVEEKFDKKKNFARWYDFLSK